MFQTHPSFARGKVILGLWFLCIALFSVQISEACICPTVYEGVKETYFKKDGHMMKVDILGSVWDGKKNQIGPNINRIYVAKVVFNYKDNKTSAGEYILIKSPTTCGPKLSTGKWIVSLNDAMDSNGGGKELGVYETQVCGYFKRWKELIKIERKFLNTRMVCDEKGGSCTCGDGEIAKMCKMFPCRASQCEIKGAQCLNNYCGGCRAEWVDFLGSNLMCECMKGDDICKKTFY